MNTSSGGGGNEPGRRGAGPPHCTPEQRAPTPGPLQVLRGGHDASQEAAPAPRRGEPRRRNRLSPQPQIQSAVCHVPPRSGYLGPMICQGVPPTPSPGPQTGPPTLLARPPRWGATQDCESPTSPPSLARRRRLGSGAPGTGTPGPRPQGAGSGRMEPATPGLGPGRAHSPCRGPAPSSPGKTSSPRAGGPGR